MNQDAPQRRYELREIFNASRWIVRAGGGRYIGATACIAAASLGGGAQLRLSTMLHFESIWSLRRMRPVSEGYPMSEVRTCVVCGEVFVPRAQCPNQKCCSRLACQRTRKTLWQKEKIKSDPDYRENKQRAQTRWRESHPDYWRTYREGHQAYASKNRELQRIRNNQLGKVAKTDVSAFGAHLRSGLYVLARTTCADVAKSAAWIVHLTVIAELAN